MIKGSHEELMEEILKRPGAKKAYDELEEEFAILGEVLKARQRAGKTQEEVAKAMGTSTSVVGRLEASLSKKKHSPTLATLRRYAQALGCDLRLKLVPRKAIVGEK